MTASIDSRWLIAALATRVRHFVIAAGSRSAPLTYAVADAERAGLVCAHPFFDERAAGFFALGLARSSGTPVAIITTSGTAPAHLLPAVIEAYHTRTPLVVVSADRPFEMHGVGASQTTDQVGLFGSHVVASLDVPAEIGISPEARSIAEEARAKAFVSRIHRALAAGVGERGGPVHINMGLRDQLVPDPADPPVADLDAGEGAHIVREVMPTPWEDVVQPLRTVIVAGDKARGASELAVAAGVPLLAEPSSGAFGAPGSIPFQQQMLTRFGSEIEQVVVLGHPSLSRPVSRLLAGPARVVVVSEERDYTDVSGNAAVVVERLAPAKQKMDEADWAKRWREHAENIALWLDARELADTASLTLGQPHSERSKPHLPHGVLAARAVWKMYATDPSHALVLGASNPIRYVDLAASTPVEGEQGVYAARGQAGIDGTIATARGIAAGSGRPVRVLLGDLTFFHDMNSLITRAGEGAPPLDIVVIDDGGGRIFKSLEHGQAPKAVYERFFAIPQSLDFSALAQATGWEYVRVDFAGFEADREGEPNPMRVLEEALASEPAGRIIHVLANHENVRDEVRSLFPDNFQET